MSAPLGSPNRTTTIASRVILALALAATSFVLAPMATSVAGAAGGVAGTGSTAEQAGPSCWGIKQDHPTSTDGVYWLYLPSLGAPQQFYCDMTTDGGGWVLVGRGRENWSFQPDGQGIPYYVYANPLGFTPATLSSELIDKLMGGIPVSGLVDGVRVRRAKNSSGTQWQELRLGMGSSINRWAWGFGGGLALDSMKVGNTTYGPTNTADNAGSWYDLPTSMSGVNDDRRLITKLWSTFNWTMGFAYGNSVCGGSNSPSTYLYDARGNGCMAMPFTQVWIRPRIGEGDVAYTPLGATPIPAATNLPILDNDPLPASWGVQGIDGFEYWNRHEVEVWAFAEIGSTIYVGGKFAEVVNGPGGTRVGQNYLAAFDRDTGAYIPGFTPDVEGPVYELDVTPDGRLIVGGEFFDIDGVPGSSAFAVLDPATGAVDTTWISSLKMLNSNTRPLVNDIDVQGNWVYVVGDFDLAERKNGQPDFRVWRLARFNATTGEIDWNWRPKADFEVISVDAVADKALFAGRFGAINTTPGTYVKAAVDLVTGATITGLTPHQISTNNGQIYQQAILQTQDGAKTWLGGSEHDLQLLDSATHELLNSHITKPGGDFQLIAEVDGVIYASCHCNQWSYSSTNTWPNPSNYTRVEKANYLMAFDRNTGKIDTRFFPDFYVGSYFEGPWDSFEDSRGCMWVGGDLARGAWNGSGYNWLGGFGVLCPTDTVAPPTPTGFSVVGSGGDNVLSWQHVLDNTGAAVEYEVWKDDRVIRKQAGRFWTDSDVTGSHTYAIRAVDVAGNRSATTVPKSIVPPPPPGTLLVDGSTVWSYRDAATALPANWPLPDTASWATGTGHIGFGDGDETTTIGGTALVQYFAADFEVPADSAGTPLKIRVKRDDGIAVNVDGMEVFRDNIPAGPVTGATASSSYIWGEGENTWLETTIFGLDEGTHTVSASLHQGHAGNSDASFELQVEVTEPPGTAVAPSAPAIAISAVAETTVTVNWTPSSDDTGVIGYLVRLYDVVEGAAVERAMAWTGPGATSRTFTGLDPASDYRTVVVAFDQDGYSTPSDELDFSTDGDPVTKAFGSSWKYSYSATAPAANWMQPTFVDSAWAVGAGQLGFGDGDEATVIGTPGNLVAYFRSTFDVNDLAAVDHLVADVVRDDGVIVYVNGVEVGRENLPAGDIGPGTYASSAIYGSGETVPVSFTIAPTTLQAGINTIAVAIHQNYSGSPDLSFDLQLTEVRV